MSQRQEAVSIRRAARAAIGGWNHFWFAPADPIVLGLVRILVGLVGLYVQTQFTGDLVAFVGPNAWIDIQTQNEFRKEMPWPDRPDDWSEFKPGGQTRRKSKERLTEAEREYIERWDGYDPRELGAQGMYSWSIWYHVTDTRWIYVVHGCVLVIFVLLTLGLGTRVVSVLAWLATVSYMHRHIGNFGLDWIMSFMTLYLMIGVSGAALSLDRVMVHWWRCRASQRPGGAEREGEDVPTESVSANFALRLIQVHICLVYLVSGLAKLKGGAWWNGTAVWGGLVNPELSPVHNQFYWDFLVWLSSDRMLWELFVTGATYFTLAFEISFAALIWNRWTRWLMISLAVVLHTGIAITMGLTTFSLVMLAAVASFIPPQTVHRWVDRFSRQGAQASSVGQAVAG